MVGGSHKGFQRIADKFFKRHLKHVCQAPVAIQDGAIRGECGGTFVHRFNKNPVGMLRSLQGEDLFPFRHGNHKSIYPSAPDGLQSLFSLLQTET